MNELTNVTEIKTDDNGLSIEFEVLALDPRVKHIHSELNDLEERIQANQVKLNKLDKSIDRLTNHADGFDYAASVTCGLITGIIDAVLVGEWNFAKAKEVSQKDINNRVIEFAKKDPEYAAFCSRGRPPKDPDRLNTAVDFLEKKYKLPGDGAWNKKDAHTSITSKTHRLDDYCHHPTLIGLVCCVLVQFSGETKYVNKYGEPIPLIVNPNDYSAAFFVGKTPIAKIFAAIANWFIECAKAIANQKGHLMSDISTPMGIPGSFLSLITELASIRFLKDKDFLAKLRDAYQNGIGTGKGQVDLGAFNRLFEGASSKFDARTEEAIKIELKRQAMPVILNEVLVRGFYFIRHFVMELKKHENVADLEWNKIIPINNRTIARMMTIASGTFIAVDMADAAVRAATKKGDPSPFFANMLLRVNFVGIGRFTIALTTDIGMGIARDVKRNKRIKIYEEQIALTDAKLFFKNAETWVEAENAGVAIAKAYEQMDINIKRINSLLADTAADLDSIGDYVPGINVKNPGLIDDLTSILD